MKSIDPDIPLNSLRAFCEVAREMHVTRTAAKLGVSQSSISRHIDQLEKFLGQKLLVRKGRRIVLTETGRQFLDTVGVSYDELCYMVNIMRRRRDSNTLTVRTSLPSLSFMKLIPRLSEFSEAHGDVKVDIVTMFSPGEDNGGFDVLLTRDMPAPRGASRFSLADEYAVAVAAPPLAERMKRLGWKSARFALSNSRPDLLPNWCRQLEISKDEIITDGRFDHHYMALPAVLTGQLAIVAPEALVDDYVRNGLMKIVEGSRVLTGMSYSAYVSATTSNPALCEKFCRWVTRILHEKHTN